MAPHLGKKEIAFLMLSGRPAKTCFQKGGEVLQRTDTITEKECLLCPKMQLFRWHYVPPTGYNRVDREYWREADPMPGWAL